MNHILTKQDLNYLIGMARYNIRRHQKTLDTFARRPDQSEEEAAAVLAQFRAEQEYRASVAAKLGLLMDEATDEDDEFPVVCENGCPEGYLGRHKFSCPLARPFQWGVRYVPDHSRTASIYPAASEAEARRVAANMQEKLPEWEVGVRRRRPAIEAGDWEVP